MPTYGSTNVGGASIEKGLPIGNVTNLTATAGNEQIKLSWTEPSDIIIGDQKVAEWKGTKVVYKKNSYPVNENDGVLAVDVQTRNQYSENPYIISGLDNGDTYYIKLFPYTKTGLVTDNNDNRVSATPQAYVIYGVKRLIDNPDTAWERTDDSIGMIANATHTRTSVINDFDDAPIYRDIITVDISADGTINSKLGDSVYNPANPTGYIMTYFPEFWWKRWQANGYEYIQISNGEQDEFNHSEAFYLGRYNTGGNSSAVNSKSGVAPFVSVTFRNSLVYSKNIGTNWGLMDIWRWSMLQILYLVEYADYDSQAKLGYGNTANTDILYNGGCNNLGMKSGTTNNDKKHAVIYRGVENIFGNIWQWCDKLYMKNYYNQAYKTSGSETRLNYYVSRTGYIKKIGYDANCPEIQLASEIGGSSTTYCPDQHLTLSPSQNSEYPLNVGGFYANTWPNGLWATRFQYLGTNSSSDLGSRLLYIPS